MEPVNPFELWMEQRAAQQWGARAPQIVAMRQTQKIKESQERELQLLSIKTILEAYQERATDKFALCAQTYKDVWDMMNSRGMCFVYEPPGVIRVWEEAVDTEELVWLFLDDPGAELSLADEPGEPKDVCMERPKSGHAKLMARSEQSAAIARFREANPPGSPIYTPISVSEAMHGPDDIDVKMHKLVLQAVEARDPETLERLGPAAYWAFNIGDKP